MDGIVTLMERLSHCLWLTDCSLGSQTNVPGARADSDLDVSHSIHLHQNQPPSCYQAAAAVYSPVYLLLNWRAEPSLTISHIFISNRREKSHLPEYWIIHKPECAPNLLNQPLKGPFIQIHDMLLWYRDLLVFYTYRRLILAHVLRWMAPFICF